MPADPRCERRTSAVPAPIGERSLESSDSAQHLSLRGLNWRSCRSVQIWRDRRSAKTILFLHSFGANFQPCTTRTIIEAHNGLISAENRDQGGASFRIRLPLCNNGARPSQSFIDAARFGQLHIPLATNGHEDRSPESGACRTMAGAKPQARTTMAIQPELRLRAALCIQLAKREPANRVLWMAEAENWSRLVKKDSAANRSGHQAADRNAIIARRADRADPARSSPRCHG
jgi:hypothetical protein